MTCASLCSNVPTLRVTVSCLFIFEATITNQNFIYLRSTLSPATSRSFEFHNGSPPVSATPLHPSLPKTKSLSPALHVHGAHHSQFQPSIAHLSSPQSMTLSFPQTTAVLFHAFSNHSHVSRLFYQNGIPLAPHPREQSFADGTSRVTSPASYVTNARPTLISSDNSRAPFLWMKRNSPKPRSRFVPTLKKTFLNGTVLQEIPEFP